MGGCLRPFVESDQRGTIKVRGQLAGRVASGEDVSEGSQLFEHLGFVCWGAGVEEVLDS